MNKQTLQTIEKLNPKHEQAIVALFMSPSIAEAARTLGMGESTLRLWLRDSVFSEAYRRARQEMLSQTTGQLSLATMEAAGVLRKIMNDESAPVYARIVAARGVMGESRKMTEMEDMGMRIQQLEEMIARIVEQLGGDFTAKQ